MHQRSKRSSGFTLIEVILAALIFALIATITWTSLHATFKTERAVAHRTELQETGTSLLNKIREELAQAFLVASPHPITFFKAEDDLNHDRITFSTLTHSPTQLDAHESEQTQVSYVTESHPKEMGLYLLKRTETSFLANPEEVETEGETVTVAQNVVDFNFEFSEDGVKFLPMWDSKAVDQLNRLPKIVRFSMKLRDLRGREEFFETTVDLPMSEGISLAQASGSSPTPGRGTPTPRRTPTQRSYNPLSRGPN